MTGFELTPGDGDYNGHGIARLRLGRHLHIYLIEAGEARGEYGETDGCGRPTNCDRGDFPDREWRAVGAPPGAHTA